MTDIEAMIEDCERRESKMNEWEINFIQSLIEKGRANLSAIQYAKLNEIWERIT
jgi:hypothetical protein